MTNRANFDSETMPDPLREANNEWFIATFAYDAEDALHITRETMPDKRRNLLPDLERAAEFIRLAIKDCK